MKRFLFLFALMISFWAVADAQTIVSTEPSNKKVVLEEYTGIYCTWCPAGHKIANTLKAAHPGEVFLVNIHTSSSFSNPQVTGHPDFRTMQGDTLSAYAGIGGFPTGSVNRSTSPWAQDRNTWTAAAENILTQSSPVNIGVETSIDPDADELTVNVEYYYTADEASANNYLSVFLIQNEVEGHQTGADKNPDAITQNNLYMHQHAFRMAVTPSVLGDLIPQTTQGTFGAKQYKVTLPPIIQNLILDQANIEVVAFISSSKSNILTAAGAEVDIPDEQKVYLSLENLTTYDGLLTETISPVITVKNNTDVVIDGFEFSIFLGNNQYKQTITTAIQPGASQDLTLDPIDVSTIKGSFTVVAYGFENIVCNAISNDVYDWSFKDNLSNRSFQKLIKDAFVETKFTFAADGSDDFIFDQSQNPKISLWNSTETIVGAENSSSAVICYLHSSWQISGKPTGIIFGEADFTNVSAPTMSFYYAYSDGTFGGNAPAIKVHISEDAGATWTEVFNINAVETNQGSNETLYTPASDDFVKQNVDLSAAGNKKVLVKLTCTPGTTGNALWFDQVKFSGPAGTIFVAEDAIDFGEVTESTTAEKQFTIENKSDNPLQISSIVIQDDLPNAFDLVDVPSTLTIAANSSETIKVEFTPLAENTTYGAKIVINSNDVNTPSLEITLTGVGTGTSVKEEFITNSSLKIMPNPVATNATLNYDYTGVNPVNVKYTLSDINGNTIDRLGNATIINGTNTLEFNVSGLAAGKYFLVITADNSAVQQVPVVVEK